jgi:hypothetical protein
MDSSQSPPAPSDSHRKDTKSDTNPSFDDQSPLADTGLLISRPNEDEALTSSPQLPVSSDAYDEDDTNSLFDDQSEFTDTDSLNSSILKYREEHGRTYHAYGESPAKARSEHGANRTGQ